MKATNIEDVVPGLREARASERTNRALAFAFLTHSLLGVEVCAITPDHRLRLQLIRNAFVFAGVDPMPGDVFQFLWCLSPRHAANAGRFGWCEERRIRRLARTVDLSIAARTIHTYMADQLQDAPEISDGALIPAHYVHWMAAEASFWLNIHGGFTLETYRRTPYLVLQQLMRAWRCNHPRITQNEDGSSSVEEPNFINGSDRILGNWQRARNREIGEIIKRQRERLPN